EVEVVVGKMGRVESPPDPAPISMFENVINYKSEYITNNNGFKQRFKTNKNGEFLFKSKNGDLESITNDQRHTIDV
ncbi:MAG: hypothetical protein NWS46_02575, partial [Cyclobacteriaceae bacterium]|nr:hypothetical protein [Cyclobacteriaceae bacterium]